MADSLIINQTINSLIITQSPSEAIIIQPQPDVIVVQETETELIEIVTKGPKGDPGFSPSDSFVWPADQWFDGKITFRNEETDFSSSGMIRLPRGTTLERPIGAQFAAFRWNVDLNRAEIVDNNGDWVSFSADAEGMVSSFNGRTGVVLPATNDYNINQITNSLHRDRTEIISESWNFVDGILIGINTVYEDGSISYDGVDFELSNVSGGITATVAPTKKFNVTNGTQVYEFGDKFVANTIDVDKLELTSIVWIAASSNIFANPTLGNNFKIVDSFGTTFIGALSDMYSHLSTTLGNGFKVDNNITVSGDVIPASENNIGTITKRWKSVRAVDIYSDTTNTITENVQNINITGNITPSTVNSDLGTSLKQFGEVHSVTFHGNGDAITGVVHNSRSILTAAGSGLLGGRTLDADVPLTLDTTNTRNVNHSTVSVVAGNGLTGTGTLASNINLSVVPKTLGGIVSASTGIGINMSNSTVITSTIGSNKILVDDGTGVVKSITIANFLADYPANTVESFVGRTGIVIPVETDYSSWYPSKTGAVTIAGIWTFDEIVAARVSVSDKLRVTLSSTNQLMYPVIVPTSPTNDSQTVLSQQQLSLNPSNGNVMTPGSITAGSFVGNGSGITGTVVHQSRSITGGVGIAGGGDLSQNRILDLDISKLPNRTISTGEDILALEDTSGTVFKIRKTDLLATQTIIVGSVVLTANGNIGTITRNVSNYSIGVITNPDPLAKPGDAYTISANVSNTSITGISQNYTIGSVLMWLNNQWVAIENGVDSFEGRQGAVVSALGDYNASEITNIPSGDIVATTAQGAINALDIRVKSNFNANVSNDNDILLIQTRTDNIESDTIGIHNEIDALGIIVSSNTDSTLSNDVDIAILQNRTNLLETGVGTLESQIGGIDDLAIMVTSNTNAITSNDGDILALQDRATLIEADVDGLHTQVDAIVSESQNITNLQDRATLIEADVDGLHTQVDAMGLVVTDHTNTIDSYDASIAAVVSDLSSHENNHPIPTLRDERNLAVLGKAANADKLDGLDYTKFMRTDQTTYTTGSISAAGNIASGLNNAGSALTNNEEYGDANVTFNHTNGRADKVGNSARISVNTFDTVDSSMIFQLKSNTQLAVLTPLTDIMSLDENGMRVYGSISEGGVLLSTKYTTASASTLKANLDSPVFIGTPTAPTVPINDDSLKIATTSFVQNEIKDVGFRGTGAVALPPGTTAQRPTVPIDGMVRYNSTLLIFECYSNESWSQLGGNTGATGGSGNPVFYENDSFVSENYTIQPGKNAMSAGPIRVYNGVIVTVPDGSVWTIV